VGGDSLAGKSQQERPGPAYTDPDRFTNKGRNTPGKYQASPDLSPEFFEIS
jgi:hypothetical protein